MALGDELVRTSNATPPAGEVPLTPELKENLEVRRLGAQISRGGEAAHNIAEDLQPVQTGASHNLSNEDAGRVARAARAETGGVPEDDGRTPPGVAAPSEGKAVGDAIKNFFGAMEQPGAREALRQMGVEVRPAQQESNVQGETPVQRATGEGQGLPAQPPSDQQLQQAQAAVQAQGQGQGFVGTLGQLLGNRDVQRALISAGSAISGEAGPLAQFGNQLISGQAQEEFRRRLEQGEGPGTEVAGLTPEGRQSVLSAFRGQEQREFEREQTREAGDREERRLDQAEDRIAISREQLAQTDRRLDIRERDQELESQMQQIEHRLTESQINLNQARATQLLREDSERGQTLRDQLRNATDVLQVAHVRLTALEEQLTQRQNLKQRIVESLPTDTAPLNPFSNENIQQTFANIEAEASRIAQEDDETSFSEAIAQVTEDSIEDVPEEQRGEVRRAIQLELEARALQNQRDRVQSVQQRANNIVMSALGGGSEGEQGEVPSFSSVEEAKGNVQEGQIVEIGGTRVRVQRGENGRLQGVPVQ